jgi:hypothetical protein
MKFAFRKMVLAGVIAAAFATPALAAVSASATISDFTITLYDLNPLDGIVPTISWSSVSGVDPNMATYTSANVSGPYGGSSTFNYTPIGALNSSTAAIYNATATANITASSVSASGSATATSSSWQSKSFSANAQNYYYYGSNFILSANTAVVFQANASTQATATVGYDYATGQGETASANAFMTVSGTGASGNGNQSSTDNLSSSAGGYYWWYPTPPLTQSNSAVLAGAFVNTSAGKLTGSFQLGANVNGNTSVVAAAVAAVPEPESYAMFLAGLGLIGAMARRRHAR